MSRSLATRSPPGSPFVGERTRRPGSRRSSIASSTASTSRGADPFANATSSWFQPTSPTSSSASIGSPRSFYSAAQASTLAEERQASRWQDQHHVDQTSHRASSHTEDDIGDLTITYNDHETPQRLLDRKGKGRESSDDYSEDAQLYGRSMFDNDEEEESQDSVAESQRIEAVRLHLCCADRMSPQSVLSPSLTTDK